MVDKVWRDKIMKSYHLMGTDLQDGRNYIDRDDVGNILNAFNTNELYT